MGWPPVTISAQIKLCALCVALLASSALAQPIPRQAPVSGQIVTRKSGETAVLVPSPDVLNVEVRQELKAGDVLRTNATGTLSIVFADQTQIRLGRNSTMLVRDVQAGVPSSINLMNGQLWTRSPRGQSNLLIETPSANTGIRGTSFTLTASPEQTTVQVFEGEVEFFNNLGSLGITAGQAATALLGQPPSRIFVVDPDERKQMLHYIPLHDAYRYAQPFQGSPAAARAERERLIALPEPQRRAADWLVLAEAGAEIDTPANRYSALAQARAKGLTETEEARADLVEATLALEERDFPRANLLFEVAQRGLSGEQLVIARYGARLTSAASGAVETQMLSLAELVRESPSTSLAEAFVAAYAGDLVRAIDIATQGERLHPDNVAFSILKGNIALLLGDEALIREAVSRSLQADPDNAAALILSAQLKSDYEGDLTGAALDAQRATELAPGNSLAWNTLSLIHAQRGDLSAAEATYLMGIAADPKDPVIRANRAVNLLDRNRVGEARAEIAAALQLDPTYALARAYLGRLYIQEGDYDRAQEELLAASASNPTYGQTLLLLAQNYHRRGEFAVAEQQLERAEIYDPSSPFPSLFRSAMALDQNNTFDAIMSARRAVEIFRAQGGEYREAAAASRTSRYLTAGLRSAGLDDWARFHSDRAFNAFDPASYFDRASYGRPYPYVVDQGAIEGEGETFGGPRAPIDGPSALFLGTAVNDFSLFGAGISPLAPYDAFTPSYEWSLSDQLQGLLLDSLSVASSTRRFRLFNERFVEAQATASLVGTNGALSEGVSAQLQGLHLVPIPIAFNVTANYLGFSRSANMPSSLQNQIIGLRSALGAELTPTTRLVLLGTFDDHDRDFPSYYRSETGEVRNWSVLSALSQDIARHVRLQAAGGISEGRTDLSADVPSAQFFVYLPPDYEPQEELRDLELRDRQVMRREYAGVSALFEAGGIVTTVGAEYLNVIQEGFGSSVQRAPAGVIEATFDYDLNVSQTRYFVNARAPLTSRVTIEGHAIAAPYVSAPYPIPIPPVETLPESERTWRYEYGFGVGVDVSRRTTIRAAHFYTIQDWFPQTFATTSAVGLFPAGAPTVVAGLFGGSAEPGEFAPLVGTHSRSYVGRLDHEWSDRVFTSLEYQHQKHGELEASVADAINTFFAEPYTPFVSTVSSYVGAGAIDRLSVAMNLLLGRQLSVDLRYAFALSDCATFPSPDDPTEPPIDPFPGDPPIDPLPAADCEHNYLPRHAGRAQVVWNASSQWQLSLSASYVGSRSASTMTSTLNDYVTINGAVRWRSPDKRWEAALSGFNLLDADIQTYNLGFYPVVPKYGRALIGSLTVRF